MTEKQMIVYLHEYITDEMCLLDEKEMAEYEHEFSKSFLKKTKRMFWSEKYFGSKLHIGYIVRKIAVVILVVVSLFSANQVSAKVFGFDVWKYVVSFLAENRMEERTYTEQKVSNQNERLEAKKDVPETVPVHLNETVRSEDAQDLYVEWNYGSQYIQYDRIVLSEGLSVATDAEYDSKEIISVCDYRCEYCIKGQEAWIIWDDSKYSYQIIATNIKNAKAVLLEMAEDIYR